MQEPVRLIPAIAPDCVPKFQIGIDDGYASTKIALPDGRLLATPSTAHVGRSKVTWMSTAEQLVFE